jgi:hypothetical protein
MPINSPMAPIRKETDRDRVRVVMQRGRGLTAAVASVTGRTITVKGVTKVAALDAVSALSMGLFLIMSVVFLSLKDSAESKSNSCGGGVCEVDAAASPLCT